MTEGVDYLEDVKTVLAKYESQISSLKKECKVPDNDPGVDDVVVYRFLKGWGFDEGKAASALSNMVKWREEKKITEIRSKIGSLEQDKFPHYENIIKVWPHNVKHGLDKIGQPVSIVLAGKVHPQHMQKILTKDEVLQYQTYICESNAESAARLTKETGKVIRHTKIFDLDGLGVHFMDRGFMAYFRAIMSLAQDNYPEMMGRVYVVNVPWAFSTFWRVITPMLYPQTIAKVQVMGADWKDKLKLAIDEKNLPSFLGGSCTACKNGCVTLVNPDAGFTKVDVGRRDKFELEIKIEAKTMVSWEWRVSSHDINFSSKWIPDSDKKEKTHEELANYHSGHAVIAGGLTSVESGTLVLHWDNTYSLLTAKTILYRVDKASVAELVDEKEKEKEKEKPSS